MSPSQKKRKYTYADYLTWDDSKRIEIIDGILYHTYGGEIMGDVPATRPMPSTAHQRINGELLRQLANFLKGTPCEVFAAPLSVRLEALEDHSDKTVVEPDIFVVCDHFKIDKNGCNGAPDLVIEVLSPSTARKDRVIKFHTYQKAGVREYWLVDPDTKAVQALFLRDGLYFARIYDGTETAALVEVLDGCRINLREVFAEAE